MPMHAPPHPGQFVRNEIVSASGLSVTAAAQVLGVGRSSLGKLLREHSNLSLEMALRIEMAFEVEATTLMNMQAAYTASRARRRV
jgi:addiction module HigA family antidote